MRELKISLFVVPFSVYTMCAQQVPDSISQKFKNDYPNVTNPTWRWEDSNYKVNYWDETNTEHNLIYDKNGKLSRSEYEIKVEQVPPALTDYYKKNYPDDAGYSVWMEEDNSGNKTYYVPGKEETVYFDSSGKFSRKVKNKAKKKNQEKNKK